MEISLFSSYDFKRQKSDPKLVKKIKNNNNNKK